MLDNTSSSSGSMRLVDDGLVDLAVALANSCVNSTDHNCTVREELHEYEELLTVAYNMHSINGRICE